MLKPSLPSPDEALMTTVWRIKMNSGRPGVDWDAAKEHARDRGVVGVGWGPSGVPDGAPIDNVLAAVEATKGWSPTGPRMIRRLAEHVAIGDLIWTRDGLGGYWLGRVEGPWRFDASPDAYVWDLNNVRDCRWAPEPFRDYDIPGAVVRNFVGTGDTLRRILQRTACRVTEMLWDRVKDPCVPSPVFTATEALADLMDPTDVEDVVLLWLQAQGWLLLPSSRMRDTPVYEAAFRHLDDGALAVLSVKSGDSAPVPVEQLRAAAGEARAFAFSTHKRFTTTPAAYDITEISTENLADFMARRPELLPPRVARWLQRPGHGPESLEP
jgi:hypothetical protein